MKGLVQVKIIGAVAAVLISAVVFASAKSIVDNVIDDKEYFEAKLTLLGIRDNMMLSSTLDSGEIKFTSFGRNGIYWVTVGEEFISLKKYDEDGNEINMPPVAPLPHYTPEAVRESPAPPYVIKAKRFCIVKRQEGTACGPAVEVCEQEDTGCLCAHEICK